MRLASFVGGYIVLSVIIKRLLDVDVCIPCLWKAVFGWECPGCGLTTALVRVLELDFAGACNANPTVLVVVPTGLACLLTDYFRSRKMSLRP